MKQFITIILAVLMFMTVSCAGKTSADELFDEDLGAVDKIGHGTAILSTLQHGSSPDAEYLSIM